MRIELNGRPHVVADGTRLRELIEREVGSTRGSAAVVDGEVLPRGAWETYPVRDGQRIELITAVQGG